MGMWGILLSSRNNSNVELDASQGIGPRNHQLRRQLRMARGKKKASHNRPPPPPSHKFCIYCQVHKVVRTFAKHQKACKRIWQMDHEAHGVNRTIGNDKGHGNETLAEMVNMSYLSQRPCIDSHYLGR
jgi:hypothetical protein